MMLLLLICLTPFSADRVEILKQDTASVVHLLGNVKIEDENVKIVCNEARLYGADNYVVLIDSVVISDKNGDISAGYALYDFGGEKGFLKDSVVLFTQNEVISADSLFYNGIEQYIEMFKNVKVEDKRNNLIALGNKGWYDLKNEEGYLSEKPSLEISREKKEPMRVWAQEFKLAVKENFFFGFDSVIALVDSITILCDTFMYDLETDSGTMVMPMVQDKDNRIKGSTGNFKMGSEQIEFFSVMNGWSEYCTKEGSKNEVEGDEIMILFRDNKAIKIMVNGSPKGILTMKREEENAGNE